MSAEEDRGLFGHILPKGKRAFDLGLEIVGAAFGPGTVGAMAGMPPETIAIGVVGSTAATIAKSALTALGEGSKQKALAPREYERIGKVLIATAQKMEENEAAGRQWRTDDFWQTTGEEGSTFDEIAEGVLIAAQREHEQRKIKLMGNLLANIAFDPTIDRDTANMLISLAEELTYRQLLMFVVGVTAKKVGLRTSDYRGETNFGTKRATLLQDIYYLYSRGLITFGNNALLGPGDIVPNDMYPQGAGALLYNLMDMGKLVFDDISAICRELQ